MENYDQLGRAAEIHRGVEYKTGLLAQCVSDVPLPDFIPGVQTVRNYMEAYLISDHKYLCSKPEMMRDNAYRLPWHLPKVLVNRALSSRDYWSLAGALTEPGLWASQQFYGVWPKGNTPCEVLAALISGPVANAYVFGYSSKRDNQIRWIEQVPIPSFTEEQTELIVSLVQEYYSQRGQWLVTEHLAAHFEANCRKLLYKIDAAVLEAYALSPELERELLQVFDSVPRRPLPFEFSGYGDDYERAKVELQQEKAYRAVLRRYHDLVDKQFLDGITETEHAEMERLGQEIDAADALFYEPIIATLEADQL